MDRKNRSSWILGIAVAVLLVTGTAVANDAPTVAEQIAGLQQMCADNADARAQRHAETSLYERLGGYDYGRSLGCVVRPSQAKRTSRRGGDRLTAKRARPVH